MSQPRLLILDDDPDIAALVASVAGREGCAVDATSDFETFDQLAVEDADVIVLDLMMPGVDGIEVIRHLGRKNSTAAIILASGCEVSVLSAAGRLVGAQGLHLAGCLSKPFRSRELLKMLRKALSPGDVTLTAISRRGKRVPVGDNIDPDELLVLFQPKINVETLNFVSVEALLRWRHPAHGLLSPESFLPSAEASGAIGEMTKIVIDKAFGQYADWLAQGLDLKVAINVSARLLNDLSVPDQLMAAAEKYDVRPQQIVLEVTESWLNRDPVTALDTLTRLRLKGFELSIDDFGTGHSTMQQLNQVPFSEMKLDKSFVRLGPVNDEAKAILQSSIELGHRLNLRVVAEGVETEAEWELISALGCDECQGFLIARPMHGEDAPAWLKRWNRLLGRDISHGMLTDPVHNPG